MTDIVERLHIIRNHLRTGALGQREVWEEWLTEAANEIERLKGHMRALADTSVARDTAGIFKGLWQGSERECEELRAEIEALKAKYEPLKMDTLR